MRDEFGSGYLLGLGVGLLIAALLFLAINNQDLKRANHALRGELVYERVERQKKQAKSTSPDQEVI